MTFEERRTTLNEAQRLIVDNIVDSLLVMAPAGTGKTNVISMRVANFIRNGLNPDEILCLTFTNKACSELKNRIVKIVGKEGKQVVVKTFHSLCYQLVKEEAKSFGKLSTDMMIIDEEDAKYVIKQLISNDSLLSDKAYDYIQALKLYNIGYDGLTQARVQAFHESDIALRFYYSLKNSDQGAQTLAYLSQYGWWLYEEYQRYLMQNHLLDFNDLLIYATQYLQDECILNRWQAKFKIVVVDEVQDTSLIEYGLIKRIALNSNFSAFGDFNQTIYEWRDSNPIQIRSRIIEDFHPRCLELSLNYRSTRHLVEMSANFLENGKKDQLIHKELSPKAIIPAVDEVGNRPVFYEAQTKEDEMNFIIDHLKQKRLKELSNSVILTRSNRQCNEVSTFLKRAGIECYLTDQLALFKRKSIKDLLSVVRFYLNPFDELSLKRSLNLLFPHVNTEEMTKPQFIKRYREYDMKVIDLFSHDAYKFGEPFGLLKSMYETGRMIIFDVESTGLDVTQDEVIQIAAIEIQNGEVIQSFERFIKPSQAIGDSQLVHGFSEEFLREHGESAEVVFKDFLTFIQGAFLIGHNVSYDLKIVRSHMNRIGLTFELPTSYADTLDIVRRLYPELKNHKLDTVSEFIGVSHEPTHNAMDDILATKDVLVKSMNRLMQNHQARKKVIDYYRPTCAPVLKQLEEVYHWIDKERPSVMMEKLIHTFNLRETAPWDKDEVEQLKMQELLKSLKEMEAYYLKEEPHLPMWELWTRILAFVSLTGSEFDRTMKEQNKLAVITVHQAKGLEFDYVIIPFLNQGTFPLDFAGTNQEEECRLFYVAMTRAKKSLLLTRHKKEYSYSKKEKLPSAFISYLYQPAHHG